MRLVKIDTEMVRSSIFLPTASTMNKVFSKMLAAREGNLNHIIPKLNQKHGDTTIGYYFIPAKTAYKGDSAILMDYLFRNVILRGEVSGFASGNNSFTNISGNTFVVDPVQILTNSIKYASNGDIYPLDDVTLPDFVYRRSFIFRTEPKVYNTAIPPALIDNPQLVFRGVWVNTEVKPTTGFLPYGGKYGEFTGQTAGTCEMDVIMPYVTKGHYKVTLKVFNRGSSSGAIFDAYYGTTMLKRFASSVLGNATDIAVDISLGIIYVPVTGPAKITFVLVDRRGVRFPLSAVVFDPVDAP